MSSFIGGEERKKLDSLQGTVISVLQKMKKHEEIKGFVPSRIVKKKTPPIINAKILLYNGKEISLDFKIEEEFDFNSISKRIKSFIDLGSQ